MEYVGVTNRFEVTDIKKFNNIVKHIQADGILVEYIDNNTVSLFTRGTLNNCTPLDLRESEVSGYEGNFLSTTKLMQEVIPYDEAIIFLETTFDRETGEIRADCKVVTKYNIDYIPFKEADILDHCIEGGGYEEYALEDFNLTKEELLEIIDEIYEDTDDEYMEFSNNFRVSDRDRYDKIVNHIQAEGLTAEYIENKVGLIARDTISNCIPLELDVENVLEYGGEVISTPRLLQEVIPDDEVVVIYWFGFDKSLGELDISALKITKDKIDFIDFIEDTDWKNKVVRV